MQNTRVLIHYRNHRGELSWRLIDPMPGGIKFMETKHHKPAQWVLDAMDISKGEVRTFAMRDILSWVPQASKRAAEEAPKGETVTTTRASRIGLGRGN